MLSKLHSYRPSHAIVVAYLALFVALGGSSYAAIKVTGKNVKNSSLTGTDVRNDSLTGADVKNLKSGDVADGSLLASDFGAGQLPRGAQGERGPQGERGVPGAPGERGADGPQGTARAYGFVFGANGAEPILSPSLTKNFTAVREADENGVPENGVYCLTPAPGISSSSHPPVMSVEWGATSGPEGDASAMWVRNSTGWCEPHEYGVVTERHGDNAGAPTHAGQADNVSFSIIVP